MRRVLFVDDEQRILDGLRRSLRSMKSEWQMEFQLGGKAALAMLENETGENGGAKLDHRAANRSCFWAE